MVFHHRYLRGTLTSPGLMAHHRHQHVSAGQPFATNTSPRNRELSFHRRVIVMKKAGTTLLFGMPQCPQAPPCHTLPSLGPSPASTEFRSPCFVEWLESAARHLYGRCVHTNVTVTNPERVGQRSGQSPVLGHRISNTVSHNARYHRPYPLSYSLITPPRMSPSTPTGLLQCLLFGRHATGAQDRMAIRYMPTSPANNGSPRPESANHWLALAET